MDKKLFEELQQSLGEMEDHAAGRKVKGIREVVKEVRPPRPLSREDIVKLRKKLRVSQSAFAVLLNISTKTVQKWEQGENLPNGSSLKLLTIAKKNPKMLYVN
jgi:putative transcriptional regulator